MCVCRKKAYPRIGSYPHAHANTCSQVCKLFRRDRQRQDERGLSRNWQYTYQLSFRLDRQRQREIERLIEREREIDRERTSFTGGEQVRDKQRKKSERNKKRSREGEEESLTHHEESWPSWLRQSDYSIEQHKCRQTARYSVVGADSFTVGIHDYNLTTAQSHPHTQTLSHSHPYASPT